MAAPFLFLVERVADSQPLELANSPFVGDVSRVQRVLRLQQDNMNFVVRDGEILDAAGNDDEFTFAHNCFMVAEAHAQRALHDEEQFVLVVVMVPNELALQFNGLYVAIVDLADHAGIPVVLKFAEFFRQVHGMHGGLLKALNGRNSSPKNFFRGIGPRGLSVNAQQIFRSGRTHHDPSDVAEVKLESVHVFPALDWPLLELIQFLVRKMSDGLRFLGWFNVQIDAAVMEFTEFLLQGAKELTERPAMPRHEFRQEKRGNGRVTLGQVQASADPTALFAANQDVLLEHEFADIFEADGNFVKLAVEFGGKRVDQFGHRKSLRDVARKLPRADQMPSKKGETLG